LSAKIKKSRHVWGVSKFEIDKQLRKSKDKYQLPAKLWDSTLYDVIDDIHLVQAACVEKVMKSLGQSFQSFPSKKGVLQLTLEPTFRTPKCYRGKLRR
jgi:hypothetical protein